MNALYVFIGGGIGSVARFGISAIVRKYSAAAFPVATLLANILSCILLGLVAGPFAARYPLESSMRVFLITGICGGFSTFSTFSYETLELFRTANYLAGIANILISVAACIFIIHLLTKQPLS